MPANSSETKAVIFGEVLFDKFPDGNSVLGGAPFNVAWHLAGFGMNPLFISRIGNDDDGQAILQSMQEWNMDCSGLQRDQSHPTGRVSVSIESHSPHFEILPEQAYDYIDLELARDALKPYAGALLYCGSLIMRSSTSSSTLQALLQNHDNIFVDINLRPPWWTRDSVFYLLDQARCVKMNEQELSQITGSRPEDSGELLLAGESFRQQLDCDWLIVTRDSQGAVLFTDQGSADQPAPAVQHMADTVGAGDAFSAVTIIGLLKGWRYDTTLQRALKFAAHICEQQGATSKNPELYREHSAQWDLGNV
jgi:fructokinase